MTTIIYVGVRNIKLARRFRTEGLKGREVSQKIHTVHFCVRASQPTPSLTLTHPHILGHERRRKENDYIFQRCSRSLIYNTHLYQANIQKQESSNVEKICARQLRSDNN